MDDRLPRSPATAVIAALLLAIGCGGSRDLGGTPADELELVDGSHEHAHEFALAVTKDAASVRAIAGCDPAAGEATCEQAFIRDFVARVFRRPAATDDAVEFGEVFAIGRRLGGDFASGVRAVVEVALQSPELLPFIEQDRR
jgi:hypothetical protein